MITHRGGCHCGRVRFEVRAPPRLEVIDCDCSMCSKSGYLHLIVPRERFKLLSGAEVLTTYEFNTRTAKHYFCSVCGIYTHHRRRSNPNEYAYNIGCLEGVNPFELGAVPVFDGVNHPSDKIWTAGTPGR